MTNESGKTSRQLPCLIEGYLEFTQGIPSPDIFRMWSAVALVAGAMERRLYMKLFDKELHANQFIALIAPPGVGKSTTIQEVHRLWALAGKFNLAPTSLTSAALIDQVNDRQHPAENPCIIAASELGTLIPAHDTKFLNILNDIYDCGNIVELRTRTGGLMKLAGPHIHILGGTQPKFLSTILPEEAWGMGFTSRLMLIYAGAKVRKSLRAKSYKSEELRTKLVNDLRAVASLRGEIFWDERAFELLDEWFLEDMPPEPTHLRLQSYLPRRITHLCKLAMTISIARSNELLVRVEDFEQAKRMLLEAEFLMPEIFKEMGGESDAEAIDMAFQFLWMNYAKTKKPLMEHALVHFISQTVPVWKIDYIINTLISARMVEVNADGLNRPQGQRHFTPVAKHRHGMGD